MKHRKIFLALCALLAMSSSCEKDDDLRDDSSFGEYFTCKINGVEFKPQGTFTCNNLKFYYYQEALGGVEPNYMLLSGYDCPQAKGVSLRLFGIDHQTGYLNFLKPTYADSCSPAFIHFVEPGYIVEMENLISGSMNITTFTPRDSITHRLGKIEGTFEFTVANEENDSVIHVTDGAFRFKVPNIW